LIPVVNILKYVAAEVLFSTVGLALRPWHFTM